MANQRSDAGLKKCERNSGKIGLLAVGLYASTYGIVLQEAQRHLKLVVAAVTIGVFAKAALIGGLLVAVFHEDFGRFFGSGVTRLCRAR